MHLTINIDIKRSHALILSTLLFIIVIGIAADYASSAGSLTQWHPLSEIAVDGIPIESTTSPGKINASYIEGGGGGQWAESGSDIYYNAGKVGIGTSSPGQKLEVAGRIYASTGFSVANKDDAGDIASGSGFFQTNAPVNYYAGASSWQHLIESRHSNDANNYALQIAGSFFDQDLYFRKTNNDPATAWNKFIYQNSEGKVGLGTISRNYMPADTNWNYNLLLNSQDTTSIGFHDSGASVSSIRYDTSGFTIGGDDGWGVKSVSLPGGLQPDYDSGWFAVQSNTGNTVTLSHNFGSVPSRYQLLFSPDNPPTSWVYDMTALGWYDSGHPYNSAIHGGSIRFSGTQMQIPLWGGGYVGRYYSQGDTEWLAWKTGFYRIRLWK